MIYNEGMVPAEFHYKSLLMKYRLLIMIMLICFSFYLSYVNPSLSYCFVFCFSFTHGRIYVCIHARMLICMCEQNIFYLKGVFHHWIYCIIHLYYSLSLKRGMKIFDKWYDIVSARGRRDWPRGHVEQNVAALGVSQSG